jgi:hypothetical protein
MLPFVIGARPPHHAIQVNPEHLSEKRAARPRACHERKRHADPLLPLTI